MTNPFQDALYDAYVTGYHCDEPIDTTQLDAYWAVIEAAKAQEERYGAYVNTGDAGWLEEYRSACVDTCHAVAALEAKEE